MSELDVSKDTISRRRVVQGAMWAAPAIVIATALPAAAVSTDPGTMGFASGATLDRTGIPRHYIFDGLRLQHLNGKQITGLTITIACTKVNVDLLRPPTFSGTGWSLVTGTSVKIFVFSYASPISSGGATTPLRVDFTRTSQGNDAATFTVIATGSTSPGTNNVTATLASGPGLVLP